MTAVVMNPFGKSKHHVSTAAGVDVQLHTAVLKSVVVSRMKLSLDALQVG
jgi:hypothetical protein